MPVSQQLKVEVMRGDSESEARLGYTESPKTKKIEIKIKIKKLLFVPYSEKSFKKLYVLIEKHSKLFTEESSSQVNRCSFNSPERFCASESVYK